MTSTPLATSQETDHMNTIFFPAIDLKDGQCVRLLRGEMDQATVFSDSPANQALAFAQAGAQWLHVVDLNGAFEGRPINGDAVKAIRAAIDIPIQLGGGIRTIETIDYWLDNGVDRVILGTAALRNPQLVKDACLRHPNRICVGIDAREGMVAVEGWAEKSNISVLDLAQKFEDAGVAVIIYTDVGRDGAMEGPDLEGTQHLATNISIPVIASGGVSSLEDMQSLKESIPNLAGIISGRAIYDNAFSISDALTTLS